MGRKRLKKILTKLYPILVNISFAFGICYILWMLSRVFLFASYKIPTGSMTPTIIPGDNILVSKLTPGGRIFNIIEMYNGKNAEITSRMPGLDIKRNDVIVFNSPKVNSWDDIEFELMLYYAKRCIGLPGDTISIESGIYKIRGVDYVLGNRENQEIIGKLSRDDLQHTGGGNVYPFDNNKGWNAQNMGPLYIPKKGDLLNIDKDNYRFYRKYIDYETGERCKIKDEKIMISDSIITQYLFTENYYFMAGDNTLDSEDSRFWGFVPEKYIAGKAVLIWYSKNPYTNKTRKERVLKKIK